MLAPGETFPNRFPFDSFRGLLLSRTRIQIYWPVIGWAFLVLLVCFSAVQIKNKNS